jgi:hypothetical protein
MRKGKANHMDEAEVKQWAAEHKLWDQMPGERSLWYNRFQAYLNLGVTRSVAAALRCAGEQARGKAYAGVANWYKQAARWHWRERAHAWDVNQRDLMALSERNARIALRSRRVARMEDYLDEICEVLDSAHMSSADEKLAREWLPQMRVFLRDLLVAERLEYEHGDMERNDPDHVVEITAEDLRAAQRALEERTGMSLAANIAAASILPVPAPKVAVPIAPVLWVCLGTDPDLAIDLAALRTVRAATGLNFKRVLDATCTKFDCTLRRERKFGRPVELLHLALHASPAGVKFADHPADGNWLSERLDGVRVLLLASCECDALGDWLGVVPHVITLSEAITHEDAAVLTQQFWQGIGRKLDPGTALDEALAHCPPAVSEYVVRHW